MIDGIVVDERREVHQLDRRRQRDRPRLRTIDGGTAQQREGRTKHLAAHLEQMRAHGANHRKVVVDDALHLGDDFLESIVNGSLNFTQRARERRSRSRDHFAHCATCSTARMRSPMSRN